MGIFDFLSKPISPPQPDAYNGLFNAKSVAVPQAAPVPVPKVSPVTVPKTTPLSIVSNPLPPSVVQKASVASPTAPTNTIIPDYLKPLVAPLPDRIVRRQDFKDVANLVPGIIGGALQPAGDLGATVLKLSNDHLGTNFPLDSHIPNFFGSDGNGSDVLPDVHGGTNAYKAHPLQESYHAYLANGDSKTKAILKTALEGGLDLGFALPLARAFSEGVGIAGRAVAKSTIPTHLITPEIIQGSKNEIYDFLTGRVPEGKSPLPPELIAAIKESPNKREFLKGFDLTQAKPSRLGKLLGVSQEEADQILKQTYGGPVRPGSEGALPGYRPETPRPFGMAAGLSTERVEPVGFKNVPKDLVPLATEAAKYPTPEAFVQAVQHHGLSSGGYEEIMKNGFKPSNEGVFVSSANEAKDYGETMPVLPKQGVPSLETSLDGQVPISGTSYKAEDLIPIPRELNTPEALTDFYNKATAPSDASHLDQNGKPLDLTVEEGKQIAGKYFTRGEVDLLFPDAPIDVGDGRQALGRYTPATVFKNPLVQVVQSGGRIASSTLYEEMFHAYEGEFMTPSEVQTMHENILKNPLAKPRIALIKSSGYENASPRELAREYVAKDFANFIAGKEYTKANKSFYQKILDHVREWIRKVTGMQQAFDDFQTGRRTYKRNPSVKGEGSYEIMQDNSKELNRLYKQLDREEQSLAAYTRNPEAHAKAYGEGRGEVHTTKIAALKEKIKALEPAPLSAREKKEMVVEGLKAQHDDLDRILDEHPAKGLLKYVSNQTGRLPEITGADTKKSLTGSGKTVKNSKFGKEGDDIMDNLGGFSDVEEANRAIEDYQLLEKRRDEVDLLVHNIESEDRSLAKLAEEEIAQNPILKLEVETAAREYAKSLRLLRKQNPEQGEAQSRRATPSTEESARNLSYNESVPPSTSEVKPPIGRGGLSAPELNFHQWKDRWMLSLSRETMERNLERVAGKDADKVKDFLVKPIRTNETKRIEFVNDLRDEIREKVVKGLGIKAGSDDDKLIQLYGEGLGKVKERGTLETGIDLDELKRRRPVTWPKIKEATELFRAKYDELLDMVNAERTRFDYKPIPKRDDYFRHFNEIGSAIQQFGLLLREQDLPTEISGITGIFNPGKPFSTAEMKRKGDVTTVSAIKGMDNYLDSISKQIFHIDSIQRGRALEKYIREAAKHAAEHASVPSEELRLPNFVSNLHDYTNIVSGKKSAIDRGLENLLGRPVYAVSNALRGRIAANMVGGNLASAFTNFIPFTNSLATTGKISALRGIGEGLASALASDYPVLDGVKSDFLVRRFPDKYIDPTKLQKASEMASWLFELVDKFTAKSIVSGKYYENLSKGMDKQTAIERADIYTGKILADRSIGNLPNLMNSRSLGFFTQFQTEVNNAYSFLTRDIPFQSEGQKAKMFSAIAQLLIYSYLFNAGYQKITGRRPTLDPIYGALTLAGLTDESDGKTLPSRAYIAIGDLGGNLPFTGGVTGGRLPISAGIPNVLAALKGDSPWTKELSKLAYVVPPFGGGQVKKTIEGLTAVAKGKDTTPTGKTRFEIDQTPANYARGAIFGKSSFPESNKYYNNIGNNKKTDATPNPNSKLSGITLKKKDALAGVTAKKKTDLSGITLVKKNNLNGITLKKK